MNRSALHRRTGKFVLIPVVTILTWLATQLLMPAGFHIQRALRTNSDDVHWIERAVFSTTVSRFRLMSLPFACQTRVIEWTDSFSPAIDEGVPTLSFTTSRLLEISATESQNIALTPFASALLHRVAQKCLGKEKFLNPGPYSNAPALMFAVAEGNYAIAEVLVAAGADPEEVYMTPHGSMSSPVELASKLAEQARKDSNSRAAEEFSRITALLSSRAQQKRDTEGGRASRGDDNHS